MEERLKFPIPLVTKRTKAVLTEFGFKNGEEWKNWRKQLRKSTKDMREFNKGVTKWWEGVRELEKRWEERRGG